MYTYFGDKINRKNLHPKKKSYKVILGRKFFRAG